MIRPWPPSLAGRTMLVLLLGLACVQGAGLLIHALDRMQLQRLADAKDLGQRVAAIYGIVAAAPPERRQQAASGLDAGPDLQVGLAPTAPREPLGPAPADEQQMIRPFLRFGTVPASLRPKQVIIRGGFAERRFILGLHLPTARGSRSAPRCRRPGPGTRPRSSPLSC